MFHFRRSPHGARRRISFVGALVAATALGAGLLAAQLSRAGDAAPRISPQYVVLDPRPSISLPADVDSGLPVPDPIHRVGVARRPVSVRYTFDGGLRRALVDLTGIFHLRALGQNGGTLSLVPKGRGLAVQYPTRCKLARERECPRAILEGARDDSLNPGRRPMRYGASVRMTHADLSDGANVFQKGYSVGGVSQFKLQVDHRQGHPSCVIASRQRIYRAEAPIDVADGRWHDLACSRSTTSLSLKVDGVERASVPVPPSLSIANAEPLRIGGKGANKGNDQFAGLIDNVFLSIA